LNGNLRFWAYPALKSWILLISGDFNQLIVFKMKLRGATVETDIATASFNSIYFSIFTTVTVRKDGVVD